MSATRRNFMKTVLAGGVLGQGLNLTFTKDLFAKPTGKPIIIGHQCDLTGAISSWGYWLDKAAKAACDHLNANNGIAGRPVQYVVEDTETNPPTGARKFRSLVQRNEADFVLGSVHSGVNLASVPIAKELQTIYMPQGMAAEMTESKGNRYIFRVGSDTYSQAAAGVEWAVKNLGKKWSFVFADYAWGWSHFNEHKALLDKMGASIGDPIAVPVDAKDLLPYLAKVNKDAEQLYSVFIGSQSVAYYTQSKSLGLDKRMNRYSVLCTHESISPKELGGASEGIYMLEYMPRGLKYKDTAHNRKLRDLMKVDPVDGKEEGSNRILASSHYWASWESIFFIQKAVEKSGWKTKKDTPEFIKALEGMKVEESFEHPQGPKYIRKEDHKAVIDFYMSRVENGEIHVKQKIDAADLEKRFPPRHDFTKESF
ncbi:MAG: ABC transporter substrate-binding protein [Rhodospirillales bacterium]|nr:ABC transporter substrate-binding protein [Rhodospirillales bacterium]